MNPNLRLQISDFFEMNYEVLAPYFKPMTLYMWLNGKRSPVSVNTARLLVLLKKHGLLEAFVDLLERRLRGLE